MHVRMRANGQESVQHSKSGINATEQTGFYGGQHELPRTVNRI